jgi:hypothetical protein
MKRNYTLSQRCIAYILLISLLLQSCNSLSSPLIPNKQIPVEEKRPVISLSSSLEEADEEREDLVSSKELMALETAASLELTPNILAESSVNLEVGIKQESTYPESQVALKEQRLKVEGRLVASKGAMSNRAQSSSFKQANPLRSAIKRSLAKETRLQEQKSLSESQQGAEYTRKKSVSSQKLREATIQVAPTRQAVSKVFLAKGGHKVRFKQLASGAWQAEVEESLPAGISRKVLVSVYEVIDARIVPVSTDKPAFDKYPIVFDKQNHCVFLGSMGLLGGMKRSDKGKTAKKKQKISYSNLEEEGALYDDEIELLSSDSGNERENEEIKKKGEEEGYQEEKDHHYFTKCEYYTRYASTSHFAMNDCKYWGTYFRSTGRGGESGRFAEKEIESKTFKNLMLNIEKGGSYNSRTGTFRNPYSFDEYRKRVEKPEKFQAEVLEQDLIDNTQELSLDNSLYEELLDYRNQICLQVFNQALKLLPNSEEKIELIHHNEYPCLIIKVPFAKHFKHPESWNKLFIAYYVAIVNKEAEKADIPIEMVIRAGFGHLLPSIDVTGNSFRINVGIVPECYGEVIAKSLATLQDIIIKKLNISLREYEQIDTDKINKQIEKYNVLKNTEYNSKIEEYNKLKDKKSKSKSKPRNPTKPIPLSTWDKKQKCYEIIQLAGDSSGKSVLCQITRKRIHIDLLADYVAEELDKHEPDFTLPIVKMLEHLKFMASVSMDIKQSHFHRNAKKWPVQENLLLQKDEQFWKIITQTVKGINGSARIYDKKSLLGLYSKLEKANKEFIIRSASTIVAEDELGSDSEYEAKGPEEKPLYAKKLIVTTGMMAINVAHYLARYYLKKCLDKKQYRTECKSMYFETEESLKLSAKNPEELAVLNNREKDNPSILFFDLNHCDVSGAQRTRLKHYMDGDLVGKNIPIIVMDYSSSTPSHIKCAINDAIASGVKLILLVSSGLKNEQLSADNPYGTIRIITLDKAQREELYEEATKILKKNGSIPATAHKIRKGYKKARIIPTNQQILTADTNRKPFEEQDAMIVDQFKNTYEIERYKRILLEQIDELFKRPIKISQDQRELIGNVRASELEKETVVGHVENVLLEMIVHKLQEIIEPYSGERIRSISLEFEIHKAKPAYPEYKMSEESFIKDKEAFDYYKDYPHPFIIYKTDHPSTIDDNDEENDSFSIDGEEISSSSEEDSDIINSFEDYYINEISKESGDLDGLSELIKVSKIEDDMLSQILYDNFITIDGMDDILGALEYNTLNLDPKLVRRILNNCDVQFYEVNPTQNGFLVKYLKESIKERFKEIAAAYQEGRD